MNSASDPRRRPVLPSERRERGLGELGARLGQLRREPVFAVEPEQADERREGQALDDQRRQHHREGGEHDQVALREVGGKREGGRERHQPAHPAPADQHAACAASAACRRRAAQRKRWASRL